MGQGVRHDGLGSFQLSNNMLLPPGASSPGKLTSNLLKSLYFVPTSNPTEQLGPFLSMATDSLLTVLSECHLQIPLSCGEHERGGKNRIILPLMSECV